MKKDSLFGRCIVTCMLIAGAGLSINVIADDDDDDSGCEFVEATLVSFTDDGLTTQGVIRGDIEGTTMFQIGELTPIGTSLAYTGSLTIMTEDGSFTTTSTGAFEPAPGGLGTQYDRLIPEDGTGIYAGATGELFFNYRTNEAGNGFLSSVSGTICLADSEDEDD